MKCPRCGSEKINKNGHRRGKHNLICKACRRQFLEHYYPRARFHRKMSRKIV